MQYSLITLVILIMIFILSHLIVLGLESKNKEFQETIDLIKSIGGFSILFIVICIGWILIQLILILS